MRCPMLRALKNLFLGKKEESKLEVTVEENKVEVKEETPLSPPLASTWPFPTGEPPKAKVAPTPKKSKPVTANPKSPKPTAKGSRKKK